jgi:hypothetical protein
MELNQILPKDSHLDLQAEAWGTHQNFPESVHVDEPAHSHHVTGTIAHMDPGPGTVEYIRADLVKELTRILVDHYSRLLGLVQEGPGKSGQTPGDHPPPLDF